MNASRQARQLAELLAPVAADTLSLHKAPDERWAKVLPLDDELATWGVLHELRRLVKSNGLEPLAKVPDLSARLEQALAADPEARRFLWCLLTEHRHPVRRRWFRRQRDGARRRRRTGLSQGQPRMLVSWVSRQIIAAILNGVILLVLLVALVYHYGWDLKAWWDVGLLTLFAIWAMSFLPGWLFVRFLGQRARALWWDFVLALHRLGIDERRHLPEPPLNSHYYRLWRDAGGSPLRHGDGIYREKFDAYYGKSISRIGTQDQTTKIWSETLFPVILLTAVLAAAWTAVLWDTSSVVRPSGAEGMLKIGFLGAYTFIVQMLIRRYFQSDLRASAYASAVVRIFVVAILVAVLYQLPVLRANPGTAAVVAFVVGFFPLVGMQAMQSLAATVLRQVVPSLNPDYPLNQIEGLSVWYEARLLEEGIEDMQNLTTTNLVDVVLHTHVPVGRLVDWLDQAYLYQHLDRTELSRRERRKARKDVILPWSRVGSAMEASVEVRPGTRERHLLRRMGIRTATDLLDVLPRPRSAPDRRWLDNNGLDSFCIAKLVDVLAKEPGIQVLRRWKDGARFDPDPPGRDVHGAGGGPTGGEPNIVASPADAAFQHARPPVPGKPMNGAAQGV
jgi:hypothetical protein